MDHSFACVFPSPEGGIGEKSSSHRLQGNSNAHLLHHVLLVFKINIHLHTRPCSKSPLQSGDFGAYKLMYIAQTTFMCMYMLDYAIQVP
jgi:hypothetical protein